jgi:hypothetical protein
MSTSKPFAMTESAFEALSWEEKKEFLQKAKESCNVEEKKSVTPEPHPHSKVKRELQSPKTPTKGGSHKVNHHMNILI